MQKHLLTGIIGLIVGMAIGFTVANRLNQDAASTSAENSVSAASAPSSPTGSQNEMQPDVSAMIERAQNEPRNFAVQMEMGQMYAKIGRFDKAIEFFRKGLAINPGSFQANVVLANALFDSRQFEDAERAYLRALEIDPKNANARADLGTTFVERQNPDYGRAISEFESALRIDPKHEPSLYYLGIAYFRKGDFENARQSLKSLEAVNPASDLAERLKRNIAIK